MVARPCTRVALCTLLVAVLFAAFVPPSHAARPWYTETIEGAGYIGDFIRIAVDHDGIPHVVYFDYNNFFVTYATRVDGVWTTEVIAGEAFSVTEMDIAVDPQGVPHVSYHAFTAGPDELRYANRVGGSWSVEDVDGTANDVGRYNAIAIDSQGNPHISYWNETLDILMYATKNGGWSITLADGAVGSGRYTDIALDSSDRPHIAYYYNFIGALTYATRIGTNWFYEYLGSTDADYKGIALDPAGNPVILTSLGGYLSVRTRKTNVFVNAFSHTPSNVDGAIAVGNDGTIHVLYQDLEDAANDLWYVEVKDSVGELSPVVLEGDQVNIGEKCDVALDPYGNPVGVYFDQTNGDAMFVDSGVRLSTALSGVTWPVGGERSVTWRGAGSVDLMLSTDGGASYTTMASGLTGGGSPGGGTYNFTVPHQPSRFCKIKLVRHDPYSASLNDSLFTIEASVALLNLVITLPEGGGTSLTWSTDPGPEDLAGYRVDRRRDEGAWSTLVALTDKTSYHDAGGLRGDEYRLYAVNGLGEEMLIGNGTSGRAPSITALAVFPNPFRSGELTVDFATAGGLAGAPGRATVAVYDVAGRLVQTLAEGTYAAGAQRVTWDGRNANGETVSSGVYFVRAVTGAETHTKKVLVVR